MLDALFGVILITVIVMIPIWIAAKLLLED